jgi:O-antigen/teichoic acid export membrane protein
LGVVSGILSARLLGPQGRGELTIISYFPGVMASLFSLAVPQALTLFLSKDSDRKSEIVTAGFRISILLGIVGSIIFAIVAPYTLTVEKRYLGWAIALTCLVSPAMVINPNMYAIQRGLHRFNTVNGILVLTSGGMVLGILALWWAKKVSPLGIALLALGLQMAVAVLHISMLGFSTVNQRVGWETYRMCLTKGVKFFLPVIAITLFYLSDRAILIRTTTLEQIGFYSIAYAVTFPLTLAVEAFAQIGFVEVAGMKDERASFLLAVRRFQMAQIVVLISALLLLPFLHPVVRYAFGERFSPAVGLAYYMVAAMSLRGLSKAMENSLRARDLSWPGTASSLAALFILAVLGAWWVPNGGVISFGIALICSEAMGLLILIVMFRQKVHIPLADLWGIRPSIFMAISRNLGNALNPKLT